VPLTTCRRRAPFLPPNHFPISNLASNSCPNPTQTTTTPILSSLLLTPLPLPEAFLITPTPFNLHNCLPTGGFLQTAVSDAPRTTSPNLPAFLEWGASDTALAFLDRQRSADGCPDYFPIADDPSGTGPIHPRVGSRNDCHQPLLSSTESLARSVNRFFLSIRLDSLIDFVAIRGRDLLSDRSLPRTRADAGRRK
jgi:hypothetical protein